ncbi:hypothetical protein SAMN05216604_105111 [Pseudomonas agarici]|nr:hypothetical protein SAMN05216604_105111 [Pseudomonas agarici]
MRRVSEAARDITLVALIAKVMRGAASLRFLPDTSDAQRGHD